MKIRQFSMEDYEAVIALWQRAGEGIRLGWSDTRPEIEKKLSRDPDLFLIAEEDGQIVGAVLGGFDGRRGFVYHLATDPQYRNRGIASALMGELESRLRSKGCLKLYLLVTNDNDQAKDFYLKRGWEDMTVSLRIYGKELI